jgi:tetratricopeptide (TPR) repeat protein
VSAEFPKPAVPLHPEQWELFELLTEGSTELNAHVKAHVAAGCQPCGKHLDDIGALSNSRQMKAEFDAFFDELPSDDAPAGEREEFLLGFKKKSRPADRLGRLAHDGRQIAGQIVNSVSEEGLAKARELLGGIEADPSRGYAYLYACQLAMPKVASDPARYVELAAAIAGATRGLPYLADKGPAQPVCREQVLGEAALLESNALNFLGKPSEARTAAQRARVRFLEAGEDCFALALADYFEGSAATFEGDFRSAWRLLKAARAEFQSFGQENWEGRSDAALGTVMLGRGKNESAVFFFESALRSLHPVLDEAAYANTVINRAASLVSLGRLDAAKSAFAKGLVFARRLNLKVGLLIIRYGLATIELLRNRPSRALALFQRIHEDAGREGFSSRVLSADLRIAECLGRLGRVREMTARLKELRNSELIAAAEFDSGLRELFATVDQEAVSTDHLAHLARFVEGRDRGSRTAYKPFRLVANGS